MTTTFTIFNNLRHLRNYLFTKLNLQPSGIVIIDCEFKFDKEYLLSS